MRIRTFLKPLSFIPAIVIMYAIFYFSGQEAEVSSSMSYKASYMIVEAADYMLDANLEDYQIADYAVRFNGITRKIAHMAEYFALAVAVSFPLYVYGLHGILLVLVAGAFCIAFACGDEYHQSFVMGRSPEIKDVGIDSFGILVGILLVRIIGWTGRNTLFRPVRDTAYDRQTRKELKRLKKEQKEMRRRMEQGGAPGQAYAQQGGAPGQAYASGKAFGNNQGYPQGQPYNGQGYPQGQPYNGQGYPQGQPYNGQGYPQGQPYNGQGYPQGNPYAQQGTPYGNPGYDQGSGQPYGTYGYGYPGSPYGQPPYPYSPDDEIPESSDDLSEDMPLSHLLSPKKGRQ